MIIDECNLIIKAGNGGSGIISWRREAHYPEGGPFGGDGGKGGDVIVVGDNNINSLIQFKHLKKIIAQNGENGKTKQMSGKNGIDTIIKVPIGTQIFNKDTNKLIVDIINHNQKFIIAYGGDGGHGNAYFKSSFNKAPTLYENGDYGESLNIKMILKYIADIGLIGLPNAGKSSLIACLTNAKPKIANYQFTTLSPNLGICRYKNKSLVIADIPGLIKGASKGIGLGTNFLKHIERCHILVHIISLDEIDHINHNIIEDFNVINQELNQYDKNLLKKQILFVANKSDVQNSDIQLNQLKTKIKNNLIVVSTKEKTNIDKLKLKLFSLNKKCLSKNKNVRKNNDTKIIKLNQKKEFTKTFEFKKISENCWKIESKYLSYWLHKIPQTTKDNIYRFNQKLNNCKIDEILKENGAKPKDTIIIDNMEFQVD